MSSNLKPFTFKTYAINDSFPKSRLVLRDLSGSKTRHLNIRLDSAQKRLENLEKDQKTVQRLLSTMKTGLEEPNVSVNSFEIEENANLPGEFDSIKKLCQTENDEKFEIKENILNPFKRVENYKVNEIDPKKKSHVMEKTEKFEINDNIKHHFNFETNHKGDKVDKVGAAVKREPQEKSISPELSEVRNKIPDEISKIEDKPQRIIETDRSQKSEKTDQRSNNEKKLKYDRYQSKPNKLYVKEDMALFLRNISKDMEEFVEILSEEDIGEEEKGYFIVKINKIRRDLDRIEVVEDYDDANLKRAAQEKNNKIADLNKEIETLKAGLSKYHKDFCENQSENENLKIKLGEARSEISKITSDLMKCLGEKDEMIKKLTSENEDLSIKVKAVEKEKDELEKKFEECLNKFKKELQKTRQTVLELTEKQQKSDLERETLQMKLDIEMKKQRKDAELNSSFEKIKNSLSSTKNDFLSLAKLYHAIFKDFDWSNYKLLQIIDILEIYSENLDPKLRILKEDLDSHKELISKKKGSHFKIYRQIMENLNLSYGFNLDLYEPKNYSDDLLNKLKELNIKSENKNYFLKSSENNELIRFLYIQACSIENLIQNVEEEGLESHNKHKLDEKEETKEDVEELKSEKNLSEIHERSDEEDTNTQHSK